MKRYARQWHQRLTMVCFACLLGTALFSGLAQAADKHFIGPSGLWNTPSVWSPAGIPAPGDNVYLDKESASNDYLSYNVNLILNYLNIYNTGDGSMTLHQGNLGVAYNLTTLNEKIGGGGIGSHYQYRGSNTVTNLILGGHTAGTYNLQGETATVNAATLTIYSYGKFNLTSGTLKANAVNLNPDGIFNQTGGTFNGVFKQDGGKVTGTFTNNNSFTYDSGLFTGQLINYGEVVFGNDFTAENGVVNYSEFKIDNYRKLTFNGLGMKNNGTLNLSGGALSGSGDVTNNGFIQGYGAIGGSGGFTNNAFITQDGGDLKLNKANIKNYGTIDLQTGRFLRLGSGVSLTNSGTMNLNGAVVTGGTLVNGGVITGPGLIDNYFTNVSEGTLLLGDGATRISSRGTFPNYGLIHLTGATATLSGDELWNYGVILGCGQIQVAIRNNGGRVAASGGVLHLSRAVSNRMDGVLTADAGGSLIFSAGLGNSGVISLRGGVLDTGYYDFLNDGTVSGYGTLCTTYFNNYGKAVFASGVSTISGVFRNYKDARVEVDHAQAIFTNNFTNDAGGTMKNTGGVFTFAGSYTNNGTYLSDPATQTFTDLLVGATGVLGGGKGDYFLIQNNFANLSKENVAWNTLAAELKFTNGADNLHDFFLPGADRGPSQAGYRNNFAWGILDLSGQTLNLLDGNTASGGAFYVSEILGAELTGQNIANIFGHGLNIYYDPLLAGNAYLHGRSYVLQDGGLLAPISATPVPGSLWLILSGLLGLAGVRRLTHRN